MPRKSVKPSPRKSAAKFRITSLDDALGFRLRMLDAVISKSFSAHFKTLDITPVLYSLIVLIEDNPGARQVDLSEALNMHESNLVQQFALLLRRGLIQRQTDTSDRRAKVLKLTEAGRSLARKLAAAHAAHAKNIKKVFGPRSHDQLISLAGTALTKARKSS